MIRVGVINYCSMFINKGVVGGPFGPSREGPGVRQKMASDTKQMIKGRKKKKKRRGKGKKKQKGRRKRREKKKREKKKCEKQKGRRKMRKIWKEIQKCS